MTAKSSNSINKPVAVLTSKENWNEEKSEAAIALKKAGVAAVNLLNKLKP